MPRLTTLKAKETDFTREETVECEVCKERKNILRYFGPLNLWFCSNECLDKALTIFRRRARAKMPKIIHNNGKCKECENGTMRFIELNRADPKRLTGYYICSDCNILQLMLCYKPNST